MLVNVGCSSLTDCEKNRFENKRMSELTKSRVEASPEIDHDGCSTKCCDVHPEPVSPNTTLTPGNRPYPGRHLSTGAVITSGTFGSVGFSATTNRLVTSPSNSRSPPSSAQRELRLRLKTQPPIAVAFSVRRGRREDHMFYSTRNRA